MFTFLDENVDMHVLNNVIDQPTAERAKEFFHQLPLHLPPPHAVPSPDKELAFYWFYNLHRVEAYLDIDGNFTWIGRFGDSVDRGGDEPWTGGLPAEFLAMLTRLYEGSGYEP